MHYELCERTSTGRNAPPLSGIASVEPRLSRLLGTKNSMSTPWKTLSWVGLAAVLVAYLACNAGYLLFCHLIESGAPIYIQGSNWRFSAIYSPAFLLINLACLSIVGAPRISLPKISFAALFLGALGLANFVGAMIVAAMYA